MTINFIHSFQSEWIKKKRSLSSWLVIIGGFFTPAIIIVVRIVYNDQLPSLYSAPDFWERLWKNSWESMAIFLLPVGVMLATSLMAQLEYRNNTWKQLHTTPLSLTTIFFSKLVVILVMMAQCLLLFNVGIYLSAIVPWLFFSGVSYPKENIDYVFFLKENALYFVDCLPIVALQFLISLKYKNFIVSIGVGFLLWVGALASLAWKYGYLVPYTYSMYHFVHGDKGGRASTPDANIHVMAIGYFVLITCIAYILYVNKKEKG